MKVDSALSLSNKIHCVTLFLMCFPGMDCYSVEVCLRGSSVTASLKTALSNIYISSGGHMKKEESRSVKMENQIYFNHGQFHLSRQKAI